MNEQGKAVQSWTIWPCDHGGVQREFGKVRPGHRCAQCGAAPIEVCPASDLHALEAELERCREALERIASVSPTGNGQADQRGIYEIANLARAALDDREEE